MKWKTSSLALVLCVGCATPPAPPSVPAYLRPGPAPAFESQIEQLETTAVRLRSGDYVLEAQGELVVQAVAVHFNFVNLSTIPVPITAANFSLTDQHEVIDSALSVKDVLQPLWNRADYLEHHAKEKKEIAADAIVNPGDAYTGGSVSQQEAKTARAEAIRLGKTLSPLFSRATVRENQKVQGTVYFARPLSWPATLRMQVGGQTLIIQFLYRESSLDS